MSADLSLFGHAAFTCGAGHDGNAGAWLIVDADARPDLRSVVSERDDRPSTCHLCGARVPRQVPLAVLKRKGSVPAILVVPPANGSLAPTDQQAAATHESHWPSGPPVIVGTSRVAAGIAFSRDLGSDTGNVRDAEADVKAKVGRHKARAYRQLLDDLIASIDNRAHLRLVAEATVTDSAEAFVELLRSNPRLLTTETEAMLDREYAQEEDLRINVGRTLLLDAQIDPVTAWAAHHERMLGLGNDLAAKREATIAELDASLGDHEATITIAAGALGAAFEESADDEYLVSCV